MRIQSEHLAPGRTARGAFAAALLAAALTWNPAVSQTSAPQTGAPATAEERGATAADLRREIEGRYEVIPLSGGVLLRPRQERLGVRSVEVTGSSVAVNGERVSASVLRAWLGAEAEPLLRLAALDPAARRELFGLRPEGGASAVQPPPTPGSAETSDLPVPGQEPGLELPEMPEAPEPPDVPEAPEPPSLPDAAKLRSGTRLQFGGSETVKKNEVVEDVVTLGGPIRVDGEVLGDAAAIGGSVRINGKVGGDVVAVGGTVRLGPKSEVMGDVTSAGGQVIREAGSRVHGEINEAGGPGRLEIDGDRDFDVDFWPWVHSPFNRAMQVFWSVLGLAVLGLLVALVVVVARERVERVERMVAEEPWKSVGAGLLAQLLFIPLLVVTTIVLVISIIGIPVLLLYPFVFLGLLLAALVGFAAVALRLGRLLEARFDRRFGTPVAAALVGVVAIEIWNVVGKFLGLGGGVLDFLAWMFVAFGFLVGYLAWTAGFGAMLLTRFGAGPRLRRSLPAEPDLPPLPPVGGPTRDELEVPPRRPDAWGEPEAER
jgi:hypothetical protein